MSDLVAQVTHKELGRLKSMQLKWHADGLQEEVAITQSAQ
jgi:hypothetical protein